MRRAGEGLRRRALEDHSQVPDGPVPNRWRPRAGLLVVASVIDEAAVHGVRRVVSRAKRARTGGRSALSIWTCDLEGPVGARAGVRLTRRSLAEGGLIPVVAGELFGYAARVRSVAFGRLAAVSLAAIVAGVPGGTNRVALCPTGAAEASR